MELWAAIDLMGGSAVTLVQGRPEAKTVWDENPLDFARRWQAEGADGIHIVDLDAAFGTGSNESLVSAIVAAVEIPVELGGGMRTLERAQRWLREGVARVVIGTIAYRDPGVLRTLIESCGADKVVVAADYRDDDVVTKGWKEGQGITVMEAAKMFEGAGVRNLLTTCVGRDGMGSGPDVETVTRLVGQTDIGIIASGGIRNVADLRSLERAGARGAVVGRALYDGGVKLTEIRRGMA